MNGLAMPMSLMDGDIIYVPKTTMGGWNEAIQELLPSLQLISGVLQPFVQIEYLKDSNR
jgi:polysaccharide export outer membrane protein